MTQEIVPVQASQAVASPDPWVMGREQLELLKRTVARGATDDEFRIFVEVCQRRHVDPFSKMVYLVKRWNSQTRQEEMALQSSIDYFRLTAERNGKYAGQVGPEWCGQDGVWKDVWLAKDPPRAARVGVLRSDFKEPLYAVALWDSYVQKKKDGTVTHFWAAMGPLMLGKCAEALAIRRAFPEDLAGLYTSDEMAGDERATVDTATGEIQGGRTLQVTAKAAAPRQEASAPAPRVVDVKPARESNPPRVQPAASQDGTGGYNIDELVEPKWLPDGKGCEVWGIPIEAKTWDGWDAWKKYDVVARDKKATSKSDLKDYTWEQATQGSVGGKRERSLRSGYEFAARNLVSDGKVSLWGQRAVRAWWQTLYDRRTRELEDQRAGDLNAPLPDYGYEEQGIPLGVEGDSAESLPF